MTITFWFWLFWVMDFQATGLVKGEVEWILCDLTDIGIYWFPIVLILEYKTLYCPIFDLVQTQFNTF